MKAIKEKIKFILYNILSFFSPRLSTVVQMRVQNGFFPNLSDPKLFCEKLSWLKLYRYADDPLVIRCADKVAVRDYIREKGFGDLLNEIYGVYDNVEDIPWDELPEKCVIKWNFGFGMNLFVNGDKPLDIKQAKKTLKKWNRKKIWYYHAEMHYKKIPHKLICEKYLELPKGVNLIDYKLYVFSGEVKAILVISRENGVPESAVFMSPEWEYLSDIPKRYEKSFRPERPDTLNVMIDAASALAAPFPFVRVDFYEYMGRAILGEMTFTPAAAINPSETLIDKNQMGEYIYLH